MTDVLTFRGVCTFVGKYCVCVAVQLCFMQLCCLLMPPGVCVEGCWLWGTLDCDLKVCRVPQVPAVLK